MILVLILYYFKGNTGKLFTLRDTDTKTYQINPIKGAAKVEIKTPDKREIIDYGWGGRRFGKRANNEIKSATLNKREILDYGWGGRRFGKRGFNSGKNAMVNKREILDYGWGGRRFGKRGYHMHNIDAIQTGNVDQYSLGGRILGKMLGKRAANIHQKKSDVNQYKN